MTPSTVMPCKRQTAPNGCVPSAARLSRAAHSPRPKPAAFASRQMDVCAEGAHAPVFVARNREISGESSSAAEPRYEGLSDFAKRLGIR